MIRRRGLSDAAAALSLGIPRQTLSRWKQEQPELEDWLAMAREQYREAKLALVDEAKTADGRPDWKAAVWALAKAFPEDYGRSAGTARQASAAAFFPNPEQSRTMCGPTPAEFGALIEENEALRAELRALRP
jgi:hypothetical protein